MGEVHRGEKPDCSEPDRPRTEADEALPLDRVDPHDPLKHNLGRARNTGKCFAARMRLLLVNYHPAGRGRKTTVHRGSPPGPRTRVTITHSGAGVLTYSTLSSAKSRAHMTIPSAVNLGRRGDSVSE